MVSQTVQVALGSRSYDIVISAEGNGIAGALPRCDGDATALIVTDSNVGPLYSERCEALVRERGWSCETHAVPAGEASKSLGTMGALYDRAANAGLERRSVVVALGGGVVGDLAGFLAATFMRGVRYVQVPTSLLAMVDSSVGGKTGINLAAGKNLVGAFFQPQAVAINLAVLNTLPGREYVSGLAEVVKYGVIRDADLFARLEQSVSGLLARDPDLLGEIVARSCAIKADVVAEDETEGGVRALLNFGHTLGHAIEAVRGYGDWLHGEAVAAGMVYAARVSERMAGFDGGDTERLVRLLAALNLPTTWRTADGEPDWATVRAIMSRDKKTRGGVPRFVLASSIGDATHGWRVPEDVLVDAHAGG